ncbi:glycosyltransferase family A protein [Phenylobacterium sp.]|jgi:glycosyltransferase involved in cell wall biosynthesis|uniref:glycosyltransferase family 2 protein n=1 Tax=Phenylobacterium sp. TaxID=1871053 RepID=UPI002F426EB3
MREAPVSVVIPLFNKAAHVLRALRSVSAQTVPPHEVIVVDDGSTDAGPTLVAGLADPRIRLLRRSPPGPGGYAARNLGVSAAAAPWVAFLDADDAWKPDHLARLLAMIEVAPAEVGCVFTGFENLFSEGPPRSNPYSRLSRDRGVHRLGFDAFLDGWLAAKDCPIWTGCVGFRRDLLTAVGLFPEKRCLRGGDKDLWIRALWAADALCDPTVSATYFRDSENMVTKLTDTSRRHCICTTISEMIGQSAAPRALRLKRLFNMEISQYATRALRGGSLPHEIVHGYYVRQDPLRGITYALATRLPPAALQRTVSFMRSSRRNVRDWASRIRVSRGG